MVGIQSAKAESLRLGEERKRKIKEEITGQKYNGLPIP